VAATAPVPRPTHHLSGDGPTARWHSRATLGLRPDLSRSLGCWPDPRRSFRSPYPPMVSPTGVHFELGPRSLDPAAVFAARMPSLFETRRRLTTSATALSTCGQPNLDSHVLAGTVASTTFLFFSHHASLLRERWCAASRTTSASTTPVLVPPACAGLPSRDASESAPPPPVARTVHSED